MEKEKWVKSEEESSPCGAFDCKTQGSASYYLLILSQFGLNCEDIWK